jgi:hypothetical protein
MTRPHLVVYHRQGFRMKKHEIVSIPIDKLVLNFQNPRFAELYDDSNDQEKLIEYLLYSESADELAKDIAEVDEFYLDRPLWVLQKSDGTFLVKDGNRRGAAVKALKFPNKYGLNLKKTDIDELPVVVYIDEKDLDRRILREHTSSLFREWDRIAKALEVYKMHMSGSSIDSMKDIDSNPVDLIKLASFYYEAVKIGGGDLKQLLRRGRGNTGGKTIIFERLFKYSSRAGYTFKTKPSYEVSITDSAKFEKYVSSLIGYLKAYPDTTTQKVDNAGKLNADMGFLPNLKPFGFDATSPAPIPTPGAASAPEEKEGPGVGGETPPAVTPKSAPTKRKSLKTHPTYQRKGIPRPLDKLIRECYDLDKANFTNAKVALVRVSFECTLKYIVENTERAPGRPMSTSTHFRNAYYDRHGNRLPTTNFDLLKTLFAQLITSTGIRKAFDNFSLDTPHQIIHNYNVGAIPADAVTMCDNLIPLLEFMLQEQADLIASLDLTKL